MGLFRHGAPGMSKPQFHAPLFSWVRFFRSRMILASLACFAAVGLAILFQKVDELVPCPLCIFQRIAFLSAGVVLLAVAAWNPRPFMHRVFGVLFGLVPLLVGAGIAGRHVWMTHLPPDKVPSCGPSLDYLLESKPLLGVVRTVLSGSGECAKVDWTLLGLSMPAWSLVLFMALFVWCLISLFFSRPAAAPDFSGK